MSSKDLFALTGKLSKYFNAMGIDYDGILEGFTKLEQQIGIIPSFSLANKIPEVHQEKMYEYHLSRVGSFLTDMMKLMSRKQIHKQQITREKELEKKFENELKDLADEGEILKRVVKFLPNIFGEMVVSTTENSIQMTDEELLSYYVRHWEMLFNIFIEPIWNNLKRKNLLPQRRNGLMGREARVMQVRDYLGKDKAFDKLRFLFMNMNTKLRNGIVHLHYYIEPENSDIVYFYRDGQEYDEKRIDMNQLEDICLSYSAINLMIYIIIGNRLELSDEIKRELRR